MGIALSIAPIFVMILLGYALRRGGIPSQDFWNQNDRLVYFLLMPAVFFTQISTADLAGAAIGSLAVTAYAGFCAAALMGAVGMRVLRRSGAIGSSMIQGAGRSNTFIALAVAETLYGGEGLQLAVLVAAVLVPGVNVVAVAMLAVLVPQSGDRPLSGLARSLISNPLIVAILAALAWNALGIGTLPVFHPTLDILGNAALPIMLLSVGANLQLQGLRADLGPLIWAVGSKLLFFPAVIIAVALAVGLSPLEAQSALIFAALPTAVAAYTLARQLGGDASLMAAIITLSTLVSFFTMPIVLGLGERLFGLG